MKLYSGQRIGQSRSELMLAVVLSCFLHILVIASAFFLVTTAVKRHVPVFYDVALVGLPGQISQAPRQETPEPKKPKETRKTKSIAHKTQKTVPQKNAMPELNQKPAKEAEKATQARKEPPQPQTAMQGPVAVTSGQPDFKFGWYLALVRDKIGQNWRPPPDAKEAKVRLVFVVNRSGWVENVQLDAANSSGTFGFQQAGIRAIRSANPFPVLPEEFPKVTVEFSVDLTVE